MDPVKPAGNCPVDLPLGLLPEREGQPRIYTATGPVPEAGHWYSPAAVRELQAAERERWRDAITALADSWDDPAEAYGMMLALNEGLKA